MLVNGDSYYNQRINCFALITSIGVSNMHDNALKNSAVHVNNCLHSIYNHPIT